VGDDGHDGGRAFGMGYDLFIGGVGVAVVVLLVTIVFIIVTVFRRG
jgi:hypothetical protein